MDQFEKLPEEIQIAIQRARHRMIETMGNNMDLYGITHSIGHLYGMMYFSEAPVTLDEMGEKMGMSKTSMSTGMRTLIDLKMVNKVWNKGSRKDLYATEPDWYQNLSDYFSLRWRKSMESNCYQIHKAVSELTHIMEQYKDDQDALAVIEADLKKMKHALSYYKWLDTFIRSFETGEVFKYFPKDDETK